MPAGRDRAREEARKMKLVFASDSFKGSITSDEAAELLEEAAKEVFGVCECVKIPVADGGEGTTAAVIGAAGGEIKRVKVHGPLMEEEEACYGVTDEGRAIVEMAAASGLTMVQKEKRNPKQATSLGTGEMIREVLAAGYRDITVALGGSATNDGGMGCMRALGVKFLDREGNELRGCGEDLIKVARIETNGINPGVKEAKITVMCDVKNPLCGKEGATYVYGTQKGADEKTLKELEEGMENYRKVIMREFGEDPNETPGAGAAGGMGAAMKVFLKAKMKSGAEAVLDLVGFDEKVKGASLVVTGEGRLDAQSCYGKVVQGVGKRCKKCGVPAVALVGSVGDGAEEVYKYGICSVFRAAPAEMQLEEALRRAKELYYKAAVKMFRKVKTGMEMK